MTTEPSPLRDNGPYDSHVRARTQYAAVSHGIPTPTSGHLASVSALVLVEALMLTGVETSPFEDEERDSIARTLDPVTVQVIAGWIMRARVGPGIPGAEASSPDQQ
ncbi:hypothetical protein [Polymorphospora sp. NPDC050346]|uniref:hypothetical protein n=1 Tax=Polymorphospora sp. NPDC050346 TaxID=3155780 RepID=UPI0033C7DC37